MIDKDTRKQASANQGTEASVASKDRVIYYYSITTIIPL